MRISTIGHFSVFCETEDACILTDPWLADPALFDSRWYVPGSPLDPDCLPEFDYLYLPRLREDQRLSPALERLNRQTRILIPGLLPNPLADRLEELGFARVTELPHDRDVWLGWSTRVRCALLGSESLLVVTDGSGSTLNAGGALQSETPVITLRGLHWISAQSRFNIPFPASGSAGLSPRSCRLEGVEEGAGSRIEQRAMPGKTAPSTQTTRPTPSGAFVSGFVLVSPRLLWMN